MSTLKVLFTLYLCLVVTDSSLAQSNQCVHCNMDIKDDAFKAKAILSSGNSVSFDAIECLVNYLKTRNENNTSAHSVTDYPSGQLITAEKAFYLKSKAVPSPMGANLSAYSSKDSAIQAKASEEDLVFTWVELKERFVSSNFGSIDHKHHNHGGAKAYAPSAIMGDHLHPKGGFMVSFRYMYMYMRDNLQGNAKISDEDIYDNFMVAPQDMSMQMYMLGAMYAPSDKITLMLMQGISKKEMDLTARMMMPNGMTMLRDFSTSSTGMGDLKLGLLYGLINNERTSLHLNSGLSLPIGDITNRGATPMMNDVKLPYAMQLGSGTPDITIGATLKGSGDKISWGLQQLNIFRTGTNSESYRFGNLNQLHSWLGYGLSDNFSSSVRLRASREGEISGADPELNPMMVTTANTANYGGELIRGALGANLLLANNTLVLGLEVGMPLYQNYNGIFMDEDLAVHVAVRYIVL